MIISGIFISINICILEQFQPTCETVIGQKQHEQF